MGNHPGTREPEERFSKYEERGAYHWDMCERGSRHYEPATEARYQRLTQEFGDAQRVLDIGCGDGYLMSLASSTATFVVGVDNEPSAFRVSSSLLDSFPDCRRVLGTASGLPVRDRSFDLVLLADVIEHLEHPERCLREVQRVVTDEGKALVTTPNRRRGGMWDERFHWKEYSPAELSSLLGQFFDEVELVFFQPLRWGKVRRRLGKAFMRVYSRVMGNPFLGEGTRHEDYGQILAVCGTRTVR